jgi:hypothetical protein
MLFCPTVCVIDGLCRMFSQSLRLEPGYRSSQVWLTRTREAIHDGAGLTPEQVELQRHIVQPSAAAPSSSSSRLMGGHHHHHHHHHQHHHGGGSSGGGLLLAGEGYEEDTGSQLSEEEESDLSVRVGDDEDDESYGEDEDDTERQHPLA